MQLSQQQPGFALIEVLFGIAIVSIGLGACFKLTQDIFKQHKILNDQVKIREEIITFSTFMLEKQPGNIPASNNFEATCNDLSLNHAFACVIQAQHPLPSSLLEFKLIK